MNSSVVWSIDGDNQKTSSHYDDLGRESVVYGPAPAALLPDDGYPETLDVPMRAVVYDRNLPRWLLSAWNNTNLMGAPIDFIKS